MENKVLRRFCDGIYGQMHYRGVYPARAEKHAIVCLHMSPKSGRLFHELLPELARNRIALAPDYPGHGESSLPPASPEVSIADYAEAVWQVIDVECGDRPVHFIGHHTGSMVAVEATIQRPSRVGRIINIGAPVFTEDELNGLKDYFEPIELDEQGSRFSIMWQRVLQHRGPGMTLQMAAESMAENLRAGDAYEWGHRAAFRYAPKYVSSIGKLRHRILVMNPNDDTFAATRRIDDHLCNGERRDYTQYGHGFLTAFAAEAASEMYHFLVAGDDEANSTEQSELKQEMTD